MPKSRDQDFNQLVKNLPAMQETWVQSLGGEGPWRRKWQPTLVFLPGKSHGQRSLVDYSPWGCRVGHDWATKPPPRPLQVVREREDAGRECPCPSLLLLSMSFNFFFKSLWPPVTSSKVEICLTHLVKQPAWPRLSVQGWIGKKRGWEYPADPEYIPGTPGANLL